MKHTYRVELLVELHTEETPHEGMAEFITAAALSVLKGLWEEDPSWTSDIGAVFEDYEVIAVDVAHVDGKDRTK